MSRYDDLLEVKYPFEGLTRRLSAAERAAQFLPFDALAGFDETLSETARATEEETPLSEDALSELDRRLRHALRHAGDRPVISVTCFVPDKRKSGGHYDVCRGYIRKFDSAAGRLTLSTGRVIETRYICDLEGEIFAELE